MARYIVLVIFALALSQCYAPPVTQNKDDSEMGALEDYMEYHRYLKEVVNALESDQDFRQKLEKAEESDIRSGKIAEELEFVSHHVRNRLNEIKRIELNRLRELTEKQRALMNNINNEDPNHGHVDHANPHSFEINDLKKLIAKTTEDLAVADQKRREDFKQYELQKEFEKQNKLNHTDEAEREKLLKEYKESEEKHKKHEKLHEPGHKAQLEEVWEEQDQMQQEFDPKTFFMLHDVDSNGLWDQDEVKALFIKELEKMYKAGEPEDDMRERAEEMERMRESVFKEVDLNRDGFIDYDEFLAQTKRNDFQQDHGWQGIDERRPYTDEELQTYIRQQQEAQMMHGYPPQGYPHQPYPGHAPPGAYQQVPPGYHPNAVPQQQFHPGQGPQHHPGQGPQHHPGQSPQQHPNAPPQGQFHPGQMPQHPQKLPGHLPDLNTNEIYPPHVQQQQQHVPQNHQPPQGNYQQHHVQQPPQGNYRQPQGNYQPNQANFQQPQQGGYRPNSQQQPPQANYQQNAPQAGHQPNQQQPPQQNPQQGGVGYQPNPNQQQPPHQNPQQGGAGYQSNPNQQQPPQQGGAGYQPNPNQQPPSQQNPQQGGYQANNQPQPPQTNQQNQGPQSPPQANQQQQEQGRNAAPVPPQSSQQPVQGNNANIQGSPQVNRV